MDILIYAGSSKTMMFSVLRGDTPMDLTNAILKFLVKEKRTDLDQNAKISKLSTDETQIKITDATNGKAEVYLVPEDTQNLQEATYYWGLKVSIGAAKYPDIGSGSFIVKIPIVRE